MFLKNALNLNYQHNETGKEYTLLYETNKHCDSNELDENGVPKWVHTAVYRSNVDGIIYSRPHVEFVQKFTLKFNELEKFIDEDLEIIATYSGVDPITLRSRKTIILGLATELWSIFPLVEEVNRIAILRALNFSEWVDSFEGNIIENAIGQDSCALARMFRAMGASLDTTTGQVTGNPIDSSTPQQTLGVLMVGLAASIRELKFLNLITVEEKEAELHRAKQVALVESISSSIEWFGGIGMTLGVPTLGVVVNTFESDYVDDLN